MRILIIFILLVGFAKAECKNWSCGHWVAIKDNKPIAKSSYKTRDMCEAKSKLKCLLVPKGSMFKALEIKDGALVENLKVKSQLIADENMAKAVSDSLDADNQAVLSGYDKYTDEQKAEIRKRVLEAQFKGSLDLRGIIK